MLHLSGHERELTLTERLKCLRIVPDPLHKLSFFFSIITTLLQGECCYNPLLEMNASTELKHPVVKNLVQRLTLWFDPRQFSLPPIIQTN